MSRRTVPLPLSLATLVLFVLAPAVPLGPAGDPPPVPARPGDTGAGWIEPVPIVGTAPAPAGLPAGSETTFSDWWKIVFQSYRDDNWEIYLASGNGGTQTRLTLQGDSDIHPRLNRGCTRIAWATNRDGDYEIRAVNPDGSGDAKLTSNTKDDVLPAWSYDGSRIAFQSYRDGQAEVYVMNADGSNQVRLTYNDAYDGEPAWSPDGTRIAFTSDRSGSYAIWVMNADGSGPAWLAGQANSESPVWAPSGQYIAYDADNDGDGFQEIMRMGSDGGDQTQIHKPSVANVQAWARSWSPDSAYIGWSRVALEYHGGYWYWTSGYLYAVPAAGGQLTQLSTSGLDWNPDWQSADIVPPSSSVTLLPSTSPSPIAVSWSGSDTNGSGVASYDVQVRDGEGGSWTDWKTQTATTSASYSGQGGHTYFFRSRARDAVGNVEAWPAEADASTTVEALAPVTAVKPLPHFSPRTFTVQWGGSDPGGSGIASYDVEYAMTPGNWQPWKEGVPGTSAVLSGASAGFTYSFRSRGTDKAGNVEEWPAGDGDASTTVFSSRLSGSVRDNTGSPVEGAGVTVSPDPLAAYPSDGEGAYSAYVGLNGGSYYATWAKAGYGDLPPAEFDALSDAAFDAILPPPANAVADWGFESGNLSPNWQPGGTYPPEVSSAARHTGNLGAALGLGLTWEAPFTVALGLESADMYGALAVDAGGTAHVVWADRDAKLLMHRQRSPGGAWSAAETVYAFPGYPDEGRLVLDVDGAPHAVWRGGDYSDREIYYSSRAGDAWSAPVNLSNSDGLPSVPELAFTSDGALNVLWDDTSSRLYLARRAAGGAWSAPEAIQGPLGLNRWRMAVGGDGSLHVVWYEPEDGIQHMRRATDGTWSGAAAVAPAWTSVDDLLLAVDEGGTAYVAWVDNSGNALMARRRSQAGAWSSAHDVSGSTAPRHYADIAVGRPGVVHALWTDSQSVYHAWQAGDAPWSAPRTMPGSDLCTTRVRLAVTPGGTAYATWGSSGESSDILRIAQWEGGAWSHPVEVWQDEGRTFELMLAADGQEGAHLMWEKAYPSRSLLYAGTDRIGQDGDSQLSQAVSVPSGTAPILSFLYRLRRASADHDAGLRITLDDGGGPVELLATYESSAGWAQASLDLSAWAGQAVTLGFAVDQVTGRPPVELALDEVSLGGAHPDLWLAKSGPAVVQPGGLARFILTFGNRGGVLAGTAVLTDTLPAELAFEWSDPPPSTTGPYLTWPVGDLAARAGPFTVVLYARASPDLPVGMVLVNEAAIGGASEELDAANNQAHAKVTIGRATFLPLVFRVR